ncbi:biotin--[acetyl-CoA-carboxylase] ligase [Erythrobacter sp. R86502]|uniref:biotin--[acetyl-CoA-carboxylase] ligase n=1 Tax=Erythrobacter sp. R86502 TaxID=3093846 RepID=UPI0036D28FA2
MVEQTGSTNDDLAAAIQSGEGWGKGRWLVAHRQTAGRGRQGRHWFDGTGNFMGSCAVPLTPVGPPPASLSFVAGLAVYEATQSYLPDGADLALKWPNDVLLNGGKLSGILLQMVKDHIIVGIGVNLARAPEVPGRKTSAIADAGRAPTVQDFAATLATSFEKRMDAWRIYGLEAILAAFLDRSIHTHRSKITVHDTDGSVMSGSFAGLDETDGALRLRLADGSERVIRAGDIT